MIWLVSLAFADPLGLDEVLAGVDERIPQILAADAKADEAEGKLLSTRGAFDPVLRGATSRYEGEDPRTVSDVSASVQSALGPELSVGWMRGVGDFPAYDGDYETSPAGEWWVGVEVPLLDGLFVGPERTLLFTAGLGAELARLEAGARRIEVRRRATEAWARWVAAGAELQVDQQLLDLAASRVAALERQVAEGARPRIDLIDSRRVLAERRNELVQATLELEASAFGLSLWYRDGEGRPIVPGTDALPPLGLADASELAFDPAVTPLALGLDLGVQVADAELRRARNGLLPKVDAYAVGSRDPLGYDELQVGVKVELAALLRKERGERERAAAAVERARAEQQAALDQLRADLAAGQLAVGAARERYLLTLEAQQAADEVLALEQRRLELGGGDLFQLLVRESAAAAARRATVDAWAEHARASARFTGLASPVP